MSKKEGLLCVISSLWFLASTMSSAFVSVYLYSYTGSLIVMILYTLIRITMFPIFFTVGAKLAQKKGFSVTMLVGILISVVYLLVVLFGSEIFEQYYWSIYFVGALIGIGESFYWVSNLCLSQLVSIPETRMQFISNMGIGNNFAKLVAPWIASLLIGLASTDTSGYLDIFKVVLVVYIGIALLAAKMKVPAEEKRFTVLNHLVKNAIIDKRWRFCAISSIIFGIRDSLVLTLSGLLVYNAVGQVGETYSQLLIVFSLVTILSYTFIARKITIEKRIVYFSISSILIASSTIVLVVEPNFWGAVYFGIVNGLAFPVFLNVYQSDYMEIIHHYRESENMMGRVIARETHFGFGRTLGMLFVIGCSFIFPSPLYMTIGVIGCSLSPLVLMIYLIASDRKVRKI